MRAYTASYFGSNNPPQHVRFLHCRKNVEVGKTQRKVSFENDWDKEVTIHHGVSLVFLWEEARWKSRVLVARVSSFEDELWILVAENCRHRLPSFRCHSHCELDIENPSQ